VRVGLPSAYFAIGSNMGRYNKGRGIEGIGIPPHTLISLDPADLCKGEDTLINEAEKALLAEKMPSEVDYTG
jgi:carboxyl-terminal processing protease